MACSHYDRNESRMNEELLTWKLGLLFATLCGLMGLIGLIAFKTSADRSLASGLVMQGVVLIFVVASTHYGNSPRLQLAGGVAVGLLIVRELTSSQPDTEQANNNREPPS